MFCEGFLFVTQNNNTIKMQKPELSLLRSKFRGSILGALMGDCLGSPYENEDILTSGEKLVLQKSFTKLEESRFKAPVMQFTDDSAMTRSLAQSLIEKTSLDLVDLAKKFVKSYYHEPNRGYGPSVITVFEKLRGNKFSDVLQPAKEQFNGQGSLGNGGAMRIAPLALFSHQDYDQLINLVTKATMVTHTHRFGVNGSILQALAIQHSLELDPKKEVDPANFLDNLIIKMDTIEKNEEEFLDLDNDEIQPYKTQLTIIKDLIHKSTGNIDKPGDEEVVNLLGNNITALHSVPTAIFCFLRAQQPIKNVETDNEMRRAIQYAITLGGDTDTIASMTGAIAGAFYGEEKISPVLLSHIEASDEFRNLADSLFDLTVSQST